MTIEDPQAFSAHIAPAIDRIAISVHPAISKEAMAALRGAHRFNPAAIALFAGALAAGPITSVEYAELTRYQHFGPSDVFLQGLAERGAVAVGTDGTITATPVGAEVARRLVQLQIATVDTLFAPRRASLAELRALMGVASSAAANDPLSPLAAYAARSWMPDDATDAGHIWNDAVVLRLHRSDAHAHAWKATGRTAAQMRALAAGPERDAIEVDTNRYAAVPWSQLTAPQRLTLLAGLGALPGVGAPIS